MFLTVADGTSCHPGDICTDDTSFSNNGNKDFRRTRCAHRTSNVNNEKLLERDDLDKWQHFLLAFLFLHRLVDCFFFIISLEMEVFVILL